MATGNAINANGTGIIKSDGAGTFTATTVTNHSVLVGGASNAITSLALTNGQLAIGATGADPTAATLSAGTGVSITNASGSITINATGGGLAYSTVTGTTQAISVNNGYVANNAGVVTLTLPATASLGDVIEITGINNATGWKVAQNALQQIFIGTQGTTVGVTGFIQSTSTRDGVCLKCIVSGSSTVWQCVSGPQGNITVA